MAAFPLSIITINYNNAAGLAETIESVVNQSCSNYEYIVVDGASTDESVGIIKKFPGKIHTWVSEKDNGIYHAMNKGIGLANGEYLMFLNSGDHFAGSDVLKKIIPDLEEEDILYGNLLIKEAGKTRIKTYPDKLWFNYFIHDSLPHSGAIFIKKKAFTGELACYDETLKIVSDWKWFLAAIYKYNYSYRHINEITGVFDFSGISATNQPALKKEKQQVLQNEFGQMFKEIEELSVYKVKYQTLLSSRYLQFCLRLKKIFFWKH